MSDLDELIESARRTTEGEPSERRTKAAVEHALLAGPVRHRKHQTRRAIGWAGAGLALAAAVLLAIRLLGAPTNDYELSLPTGDRLLARSDVRFEVESQVAHLRRVRLEHGAMLFDIAPIGDGARFEVVTANETITVLGTVFLVEVSDAGTSVRVFEGHVEVTSAASRVSLRAGGRYRPSSATERSGSLEAAGLDAAARRAPEPDPASAAAVPPPVGARLGSAEPAATSPVAIDDEARLAAPGGAMTGGTAVGGEASAMPIAPRGHAAEADVDDEPAETDVAPSSAADGASILEEPASAAVAPTEPDDETFPVASADAIARARALLRAGDAEGALDAARGSVGDEPALFLVEADALRALRRHQSAAEMYERVLDHRLAPPERTNAGFVAAELWFRRLHAPTRARDVLRRSGALEDTALRERSLALWAEIAGALGNTEELLTTARSYLREFPEGPRASWMRARLP